VLLRASGTLSGQELDLRAITDPRAAEASGIAHAPALIRFVDATVADDAAELAAARAAVRTVVGPAGLVDAAAVVGNFERMTRIADATGIALDTPAEMLSADFRTMLGLDGFASAAQTRRGGVLRNVFARALRALAPRLLRITGRRRRTG
jgi:hypothetical protein